MLHKYETKAYFPQHHHMIINPLHVFNNSMLSAILDGLEEIPLRSSRRQTEFEHYQHKKTAMITISQLIL